MLVLYAALMLYLLIGFFGACIMVYQEWTYLVWCWFYETWHVRFGKARLIAVVLCGMLAIILAWLPVLVILYVDLWDVPRSSRYN